MARASDFAATRARRWRELTPELLARVGGDAVAGAGNEDNMRVALDFALGNFEAHTFGTFDPQRLRKAVLGLAEKFAVHSLDGIGRELVRLHDSAVAASAAAEGSAAAGTVDENGRGCRTATTTSAAISCVLALARAPMESIWERLPEITAAASSRRAEEDQEQEEADDATGGGRGDRNADIVAWNLARLEDDDDDADEWMRDFKRSANSSGSDFSSSEEEDDEEQDEEQDQEEPREEKQKEDESKKVNQAGDDKGATDDKPAPRADTATIPTTAATTATATTTHAHSPPPSSTHVPTREPRSKPGPQIYAAYRPSKANSLITACRDDHLRRHKFATWPYHLVEETVIVREAFSALQGHPGTIFHLVNTATGLGKEFALNDVICLRHLSPGCLKTLLMPVVSVSTDLARIRKFCDAHTLGPSSGGTVWQAFVTAIQELTVVFDDQVAAMIAEYVKRTVRGEQGNTVSCDMGTVFALNQWVVAQKDRVALLSTLLGEVRAPLSSGAGRGGANVTTPQAHRTLCLHSGHLLGVVHDMLAQATLVRDAAAETTLWTIFERVLAPWARILGPWVDFGILEDRHDEFFIFRPGPSVSSDSISVAMDRRRPPPRSASAPDWGRMFAVDGQGVPDFLQDVAGAILLAGKSQHVRSRSEPLAVRRSEWPLLMANLRTRGHRTKHEPLRAFLERVLVVPLLRSAEDSSLRLLRSMFSVSSAVPSTVPSSFSSSSSTVHSQRDLNKHLLMMRACFLLSDVETLRPFTESMFDQLEAGRWKWGNDITVHLRRSMQKRLHGVTGTTSTSAEWASAFDIERWSASLDAPLAATVSTLASPSKGSTPEFNRIGALDGLRLNFSAPWPLSIVLDAPALERYNRIMRLLLQVKRCKFMLDKTHMTLHRKLLELQKNGCGTRWLARDVDLKHNAHGAGLLLMELMHFVNHFHAYLMDRAVRVEWDRLRADLDTIHASASSSLASSRIVSVDALRKRHYMFLDNVSDQCLLHPRSRVALQQVQKILDCCLQVASCVGTFMDLAPQRISWTGERKESSAAPENVRLAKVLRRVGTLKHSFRRTNRFLIVLIQSHIRHAKGAAGFLESILTAVDFTGFYSKRDTLLD